MAQLKLQLIDALIRMQKIPRMAKLLQPTIDALNNPSTIVPEGDYEKISEFKNLIFKVYKKTYKEEITKTQLRHAKSLIELAQYTEQKYFKKK